MIQHNTILNPQQVFLKTSEGVLNNGSNKSSVSFDLKNTIIIPSNVDAYIQLNSFKFTNSFYNINLSNNIFYYSVDGLGLGIEDIYSFEIPVGNYNINSLISFLNEELGGFIVLTYKSSVFKINFTGPTSFILRNGYYSCLNVLGFDFEDTPINTDITSTHLINLAGVQLLYIVVTNMQIASNTGKNSSINNILESVNINCLGGATQSYDSVSQIKYRINDNSVSRIDINIFDENNNLVDFNNVDWYLNISFIFSYKMEYIEPPTLDLSNNYYEQPIYNEE